MKHSESLASLAPALVKAQGEMRAITKDSINPHFKARYVSLDALTEAVRPILTKHGISLIQGGGEIAGSAVPIETMLLHTSGEWIATTFYMPLEKATAQGAGSAISYGRRYGLSSLLALTTDEDDDGTAATQARPAKKATPEGQSLATIEQRGELKALASDPGLTAPYKKRIAELLAAPLTAVKADSTIAALNKTLSELATA